MTMGRRCLKQSLISTLCNSGDMTKKDIEEFTKRLKE